MRLILYQLWSKVTKEVIGPRMRNVGRRLYEIGKQVEGADISEDRLVPSLRKLAYDGQIPQLDYADFVAPNATVLGKVKIGSKSSIWYSATLIGSSGITIGNGCVIQDRVHISKEVNIGDNVFVGPNCTLQGSTLEDRAFVSMGSTVRHATVQKGGFVAAGAVVFDNTVVKEGEIWAGNPARFLRMMTPLEREVVREYLEQSQDLACIHAEETQKSTRDILLGPYGIANTHDFADFTQDIFESDFSFSDNDEEFAEVRVIMKEKIMYPDLGTDYEPYNFEQKNMPDKFRLGIHEEEFEKVALRAKRSAQYEVADSGPWKSDF